MNPERDSVAGRRRRILNNERKFLFTPSASISLISRLNGRVDRDALRNAIDKARTRHTLAGVRVAMDCDGGAWFETDGVPKIPLRVVDHRALDQWLNQVRYEQQFPFDPFTGPLLRFVLIESGRTSDLLAFAQHAICDGTGLAYLVRDVLTYLANPKLEATPLPSPPLLIPANLPARVREGMVARAARTLYLRHLNRGWRKANWRFDMEDYRAIHDAFLQEYTFGVVTSELSTTQTEQLLGSCRAEGVSVNSALTTAFVAAYQEVAGPLRGNRRKVAIPVDMRKRLDRPVGDVLDLYVGSVMFDFACDPGRPFWDNARAFNRVAHRKMDSLECFEVMYQMEGIDGTLMDALLGFATMSRLVPPGASRYERLSSFARDRKNVALQLASRFTGAMPGVVNTNLGNLHFPERYGDIELERMWFVPPTGPDMGLVVGTVTTSGRLTLTLNYVEERSSTESMSATCARALGLLGLDNS